MTIAPTRPVNDLPKPRSRWRDDAACNMAAVTKPCGTCPVRWDCLLDAVLADDQWTYRAGMRPDQRNAWLKEEGITRVGPKVRTNPGGAIDIDMAVVDKMRGNGASWDQIAAVYGCTARTVSRRWASAHNPQPAQPRRKLAFRPRKPLDLDLIGRLRAEGHSFAAIAEHLGVHDETVRRQWLQGQLEQAGRVA